ncbi:hypothetical protein NAT65_28910 [Achromobacter xylosoxidans]|uniref:hypothetical protein n=1 Tax=Alcaligenes xylosoxydans xylosoxydans TaxID=85698 RepID=UPI0013F4E7F0|nr:hypothetical protein [Achromobacter xylosoxidans]MCM2575132.1 hypothetical protein [Achromobacter xylosoxidans]
MDITHPLYFLAAPSCRFLRRAAFAQHFGRQVLAGNGRHYTVAQATRQLIGPLGIGLRRNAHCLGGGRGSAAKQSGSFRFLHAPIKAFFNRTGNHALYA